MGKVSQRQAEDIRLRVEILAAAQRSGLAIDGETAGWLGKIGDQLAKRLARAGLIPARKRPEKMELGRFISDFIAEHQHAKKMTRVNLDLAGK